MGSSSRGEGLRESQRAKGTEGDSRFKIETPLERWVSHVCLLALCVLTCFFRYAISNAHDMRSAASCLYKESPPSSMVFHDERIDT